MATFEEQIESVTGITITNSSVPTQTDVTTFLNHSILDVATKLKTLDPSGYLSLASKTAVPNGGSARIDGEIVGVFGSVSGSNSRPATEIDFAISSMALDTTSIHYQSKFNPAYYRVGRELFIIPDGGDVLHIDLPTTTYNATDIHSIPSQYQRSIVLGASIRCLERHLMNEVENLNIGGVAFEYDYSDTDISVPAVFASSLPDDLVAPTISYSDTEVLSKHFGEEIDRTKINTALGEVSFSAPALEQVVLTLPADLELPSAPIAPLVTNPTLNFTDVPPLYTMPEQEELSFPSITDFALSGSTVLPDAMHAPSFTTPSVTSESIGELPAPPVFNPPKLLGVVEQLMEDTIGASPTIDAADAQNIGTLLEAAWSYIQEEEDPEQFGTVNTFIGTIVNMYSTAVQTASTELQARQAEYTNEVQKVMQQAQMDQAAALKSDDMEWQTQSAQYNSELQKHQADIARYNADIQRQVQEWQLQNLTHEMEAWNRQQMVKFTKFTNSMTNNMNKFNAESAAYTANFNTAVKEADLAQQGVAIQFQKHDKDMAQYTAEVNALVQEFQQNAVAKVIEIYKYDRQQALTEYQALAAQSLNDYNEKLQKLNTEVQIAQQDANAKQASLQAIMASDTEVGKNNAAKNMEATIQNFTVSLNNFSAKISKYQAQVGTQNTEFSANMNRANVQMTNSMNKFNTKFQSFQNEITMKEKILAGLRMDYAQSLGIQAKQGE